jgi:ABC-type glycerol-3-phosphate transport system substrate-binding protein
VPVVQTQVVTQIVAGTPQNVVITATPAPTKDLSKEAVTLRFTVWTANETQLKLLTDIAAEYKAKNPNVTIKVDSAAFDDYISKISIQLAGGDPPDAGWMLETAAANWIKAGALTDLAPKLKAFSGFDYADFSQPGAIFSSLEKPQRCQSVLDRLHIDNDLERDLISGLEGSLFHDDVAQDKGIGPLVKLLG